MPFSDLVGEDGDFAVLDQVQEIWVLCLVVQDHAQQF
jgi:hypothetical protein